jgi:hypothetical protein
MSLVRAGSESGDVHSFHAHVLDAPFHQPRCDAAPLVARVDSHHVHHAHSLVKCVQGDGGKSDDTPVHDSDEHVALVARARRTHGLALSRPPVRLVETSEDRVAEHPPHRFEHGLPGSKREVDDRLQVGIVIRA